jgi:hypothetical protein
MAETWVWQEGEELPRKMDSDISKERDKYRLALQEISRLAVNPELGGGLWRAKKIASAALTDAKE